MPRADEPRYTVRLDADVALLLRTASEVSNVAVGALIRECARRSAAAVAADASAGRVSLRRRSAAVPVSSPAVPESEFRRRVEGKITAEEYVLGLRERAGVKTAREVMLERQARLNKGRGA